jgi:hypothetical protein
MTRREPADSPAWRSLIAIILLISGLGSIAWSFIALNVSTGRTAWSEEQAREYQAASSRLHSLSHQFAQQANRGNETVARQLKQAEADYDSLRGQLESAMARPQRIAILLRVAGLLLLVVGGACLYFGRPEPGGGKVK